ncbi:hypothetical protein [Accumulibacter sp.]|uniref:HvfC family peptide modification chaperone n=1 Tax=Accumulibacter sp. TaxID=2053492 RepID=UPI0025E42276|nr:hypothetical protein [Accumulibacter sp.]MCM8626489.1 hypothetical protein [Accumulibacter sp.]
MQSRKSKPESSCRFGTCHVAARKPQPAWLAVCRDRQEEVQLTLLTFASSRLLDLLSRESMTGVPAAAFVARAAGGRRRSRGSVEIISQPCRRSDRAWQTSWPGPFSPQGGIH